MCTCYNILASITYNNEFDDNKLYSGSDLVYREYLETKIEQLEDDWENVNVPSKSFQLIETFVSN